MKSILTQTFLFGAIITLVACVKDEESIEQESSALPTYPQVYYDFVDQMRPILAELRVKNEELEVEIFKLKERVKTLEEHREKDLLRN